MKSLKYLILLACLGGCNAVPAGSESGAPTAGPPVGHPFDGQWKFSSADGTEFTATLNESKVVRLENSAGTVRDDEITSNAAILSGSQLILSWSWVEYYDSGGWLEEYSFTATQQSDGTFFGTLERHTVVRTNGSTTPFVDETTESEAAMVPLD